MEYAALASFFARLEGTTKRLEMTAILVEMLDALDTHEMEAAVRLLQGKVRPDWEGVEIGLAEKMVLRALGDASGHGDVETVYRETGDLGEAAKRLLGDAKSQQATLFTAETVTVQAAYERLLEIARTEGAGSQDRKQKLLRKLLSDAGPDDAKFLIRTVAGRLRLGVADMTFLDALTAWHLGQGVRSVQDMEDDDRAEHARVRQALERGYDVSSDLALVAATLARDGLDAVAALEVSHGTPLRPMAAERLKSLGDILEKHGGRSAMEYKYDGLRVQCHVAQDEVRLFSRRMEELTDQFPDVQETLRRQMQGASSCIVEGECVAVDAAGRMRPFQEISRRRGRKTGLGEDARRETALSEGGTAAGTVMEEVPVRVFLFDCLAVDGHGVLEEGYEQRRGRLGSLFEEDRGVAVSAMEVAEDEASMEAFFARAAADGAEGIMCKALDAPYKAGNRGFDWIKYKTDYTEDLVDSMDLVVVGAFSGRGRRAGWYGALLMAAYDPDTGHYASVCKLGTGFDDETLQGLRERFREHEAPERPNDVESDMVPDVWFHPAIVMEVQAAELTLSPTHRAAWGRLRDGAGLAARFPRFSGRWRDDKGPEDATTVEELVRMYEEQGA